MNLENCAKLLNKIKNHKDIPSNESKGLILDDTGRAIKEQIEKDEDLITTCLKKEEYQIISYKLTLAKKLQSYIESTNLKTFLEEQARYLSETLTEERERESSLRSKLL